MAISSLSPWIPFLKALADATRLDIMRILLKGSQTVEDIAHMLGTPEYNISKHLRILREAGLVKSEKRGRHLHNSVNPNLLRKAGRRRVLDLGCCTFDLEAQPKAY